MPAKEISEDVLRDLYEARGLSQNRIAVELGVSRCKIQYQFKKFGIDTRRTWTLIKSNSKRILRGYNFNSDNTPINQECPFSSLRMHEMYWKQEMFIKDIANEASLILKKPVTRQVVTRWLKEYKITLRTKSEVRRLMVKRNPDFERRRGKAVFERLAKSGKLYRGGNKKSIKKANRVSAQVRKQWRVVLVCPWENCKKEFTRRRCEVNKKGLTFCSYSCGAKYYHSKRRIEKLIAKLAVIEQEKKRQVKELFGIDMDARENK